MLNKVKVSIPQYRVYLGSPDIGGKQASPSLDQINIIMKFILARGLETSELILHLQNIAREIERLQEYGTGKTWYHIVHQLRKGQEVNKLFLQLKQATEELTMVGLVRFGVANIRPT